MPGRALLSLVASDAFPRRTLHLAAELPNLERQLAKKRQSANPHGAKAKSTHKPKQPASSGGSNSPALEALQENGGKAFRFLRARLCQQLDAAGDKLVLLPALHAALAQETAEKCDLDLADAEGILDEVCAHPHPAEGNHAAGSWRRCKDMGDEEFVGPLNFPYPASFWATDWCRSRLQKTEECYTEFAFTAWVLHKLCGLGRPELGQWFRGFYDSRPQEALTVPLTVPGHPQVSARVREVSERLLSPDQAKELLWHWQWHYGCEGDLDQLLATMEKHLGEAGVDLWDWIEEDLCRLEARFWNREQAKCGNQRLSCLSVAVQALFADQLQTNPNQTPQVTTEMIFEWLALHPDHDFTVGSYSDQTDRQTKPAGTEPASEDARINRKKAREAKLASLLRGLRMLAAAECLRELPKQGDGTRKEALFEPGTAPLPAAGSRGVIEVKEGRYRHTGPCLNPNPSLSNPNPTKNGSGINRGKTGKPKQGRLPALDNQLPAKPTAEPHTAHADQWRRGPPTPTLAEASHSDYGDSHGPKGAGKPESAQGQFQPQRHKAEPCPERQTN